MGRNVRSVVAVALALGWLVVLVVSTGASAAPRQPGAGRRPPVPPFGWTVGAVVVESLEPRTHAVTATGVGTYAGRLVLGRSAGGVAVVNEVGFEEYVRGVSEMPNAWPGEALKAQAIAARTYALWDLARDVPATTAPYKAVGADICATPACQAYTGLAKTQAEHGERWSAAVDATKGEVLWWRDGPIVAKYSSSNGGRSVPGGQPYLRAVDDPDDRHSPLHRWRSTLSFADVGRALGLARTPVGMARAGDNVVVTTPSAPGGASAGPPVGAAPAVGDRDAGTAGTTSTTAPSTTTVSTPTASTATRSTATRNTASSITATSSTATRNTASSSTATASTTTTTTRPAMAPSPEAGAGAAPAPPATETVVVPVLDFRERVNDAVPTPPGGLPKAVPSVRFDIAPEVGAVTLHGRGWGHGIGMSQWGAYGKATRGMKAADILAAYYGGLRPISAGPDVVPEVIRVAVDLDRAVAEVGVVERATVGADASERFDGAANPDAAATKAAANPDAAASTSAANNPAGDAAAKARRSKADRSKADRSKPPGRFRVSTPDGTVLAHAATGTWRVQPLPKGGLRVVPPADQAEPARIEHVRTEPRRPRADEPVRATVRLSHPALVGATVVAAGAVPGTEPVAVAEPTLVEAGEVTLDLPPAPAAGAYTLSVTTDRGGGRTATAAFPLDVRPAAARKQLAAGASGPGGTAGGRGGLSLQGALAGLVAAAALAAVSVMTTRTARGLGPDGGGPLH